MVVLLATATAALFGVADFLGGLASKRDSAVLVATDAHVIALGLLAAATLAFPAAYTRSDLLAGAAAGIAGGVGVTALYAALARGRMSIVAPITAALSGSLPAVYDAARGTSVPPTAAIGLVLAVVATIIVSAAPDAEGGRAMPASALVLSLVAGASFAGSFIAFSYAGEDSGFWPLLAARVVSVTMLAVVALLGVRRLLVVAEARRPAAAAGVLDAAANVAMISAIRVGPLAVASVIGSLYPIGTVLLARYVLGEKLHGIQRVGIALAFVAVLLSALP